EVLAQDRVRVDRVRDAFGIRLMPDRSEHPAVERVELLQRARRQRVSERFERLASDWHRVPFDFEAAALRRSPHDLDRLGHHFETDVVAFEYSYFQRSFHAPL